MKQEFYESKIAFLLLFLFCLLMDLFTIASLFTTCVYKDGVHYPILFYALLFSGITFYAFSKYRSTSYPYITIDALRLLYKGHSFMWSQIKEVSLTYRPYTKNSPLYLKLDLNQQTYWISLKFISDSVRRKILNAVEAHLPVQYNGCRYESNIQTLNMGICVFLFVFICLALLFMSASTILGYNS